MLPCQEDEADRPDIMFAPYIGSTHPLNPQPHTPGILRLTFVDLKEDGGCHLSLLCFYHCWNKGFYSCYLPLVSNKR